MANIFVIPVDSIKAGMQVNTDINFFLIWNYHHMLLHCLIQIKHFSDS